MHLHAHSQFSVLQATPDIKSMVSKAKALNMPAIALTDLGNMYGAFKFVREAFNNDLKPIVGCEFYVADERLKAEIHKRQSRQALQPGAGQEQKRLSQPGKTQLAGIHGRAIRHLPPDR